MYVHLPLARQALHKYPIVALFYTREEIGLRLASYFSFAAVAGAFGGLIAFGVQHAHVVVANWRLLFLIEGFPSVAMGLVAMFALPNRPEETRIFDEDERRLALERMNRGTRADVGRTIKKSKSHCLLTRLGRLLMCEAEHIVAAFTDWRVGLRPFCKIKDIPTLTIISRYMLLE